MLMFKAFTSIPKYYHSPHILPNHISKFQVIMAALLYIFILHQIILNCSTVQEDVIFTIPSGGIQQLAGAATASARKTKKLLDRKGSESDVEREHEWGNEAIIRRKRRRKIRSILEYIKNDEDDKLVFVDKKAGKSRFMTPKEEARFSWYLKERARIEAVRTELLAEMGGKELTSSQWAKAAGISQHKLDKILWNERESEERISSCYQILVV